MAGLGQRSRPGTVAQSTRSLQIRARPDGAHVGPGICTGRDCRSPDAAAGARERLVNARLLRHTSHNAKAVYQRYLGWYDGNPANLNPLPRVEAAKKAVEYMGGAAAVMDRARNDFKAGNYRWVAQVMEQVVYADPTNKEARALAAQAFEQLGYLAESATWRNAYLLGAQELRNGPGSPRRSPGVTPDMLHAMTLDLVFDYLGTRLNGPRAGTMQSVINWLFPDTSDSAASTLAHGALTAVMGKEVDNADATVTIPRAVFESVVLGQRTMAE